MPERGIPIGYLNSNYLKLDASNDPITGTLNVDVASDIDSVFVNSAATTRYGFRADMNSLTTGLGLGISTNNAGFIGNAAYGMVDFLVNNTAATGKVLSLRNLGTGDSLFINHDNSGNAINIDADANSASDVTGLVINAANLGAGAAIAANFQTGSVIIGAFGTAGFVKNSALGLLSGGNAVVLTTDVSGILPVANGGTGTATGSITGTGGLTFTAGGANNHIYLVPVGSGVLQIAAGKNINLLSGAAGTAHFIDWGGVGVASGVASPNKGVATVGSRLALYTAGSGASLFRMCIGVEAGNGNIYYQNHYAGTSTNIGHKFYATDGNAADVLRLWIQNAGVMVGGTAAPVAKLEVAAGTATAGTAPFKLNSGVVLTTPVAGVIEFTTDDFFATITTGAARKAFILDYGARLISGKIPIATTNGRLIDGQTPLSGTKIYYVSDTSGGATTRKLTFINGILTAEV